MRSFQQSRRCRPTPERGIPGPEHYATDKDGIRVGPRAGVQALLKRFGAPLGKYAASSSARADNANFVVRTLWTAMIAGPEMEEETWKAFREIAHMPEDDLKAIQDCYSQQMKPVITSEQLASLRKRYGLKRK